jgi:tetratricopeptide (TPR) repeat protein
MKNKSIWFLMVVLFFVNDLTAQFQMPPVRLPDASPRNSVSFELGLSNIEIKYHSPYIRNRKVWGGLVPYDRVWRAGANENTTITFEHPVKVNGRDLAAGTYGLHIIPSEKNNWIIAFSSNYTSWGSFSYNEKEDVLRIEATPKENPMNEWLAYEIKPASDSSAEVSMVWEKLRVPFTVQSDVKGITLAMLKNDFLRSPRRFDWVGYWYSALYLNSTNYQLDQALQWINMSITNGANFTNVKLKADILTKLGRTEEAAQALKYAVTIGSVFEIDGYVALLVRQKKNAEALELAKLNAQKNPDVGNVNGGLARAYSANGNYPEALKHAKLMLDSAPAFAKPGWERNIQKLTEGKDMNQP